MIVFHLKRSWKTDFFCQNLVTRILFSTCSICKRSLVFVPKHQDILNNKSRIYYYFKGIILLGVILIWLVCLNLHEQDYNKILTYRSFSLKHFLLERQRNYGWGLNIAALGVPMRQNTFILDRNNYCRSYGSRCLLILCRPIYLEEETLNFALEIPQWFVAVLIFPDNTGIKTVNTKLRCNGVCPDHNVYVITMK